MSTKPTRAAVAQTRDILSTLFPMCFCIRGDIKRPLKTGIYKDIRAALPEMSARLLRSVLVDYTRGPKYHVAMVTGAKRVDLNGDHAGFVSAAECAWHKAQLHLIHKIRKSAETQKAAKLAAKASAGQQAAA